MVIFSKDTYIVFLSLNGKKIPDDRYNDIPTDFCYQLREDSDDTRMLLVSDMKGSYHNGYNCNLPVELRLATEREIEEYRRRGNPYDVRKLPTDQIVNNYPIY